jgi:ABC-type antimicrobial peptide transport system permease subunit
MVTSLGNYWGRTVRNPFNPIDSIGVALNYVDENYIPLHGHKLIAGKNFTAKADSLESELIVNESLLKRFKLAEGNPEKAIGEILKVEGKDLRIVGVMKDFQYGRANGNFGGNETMFRNSKDKMQLLNVKIQSSDLIATHAKIESIWKKIDPVHTFEARFYNDQIQEAFAGMEATVKLAGFLAFLAICIASLGLLGMVVFTTEIRLKEISIRKVMGASESTLLYLLGKGFIFLLLIATAISLPLVILFFEKVVFPNTNNHAPLNILEMLLGVLVILILALVMIGSQTLKAAKANPAEVLKNE